MIALAVLSRNFATMKVVAFFYMRVLSASTTPIQALVRNRRLHVGIVLQVRCVGVLVAVIDQGCAPVNCVACGFTSAPVAVGDLIRNYRLMRPIRSGIDQIYIRTSTFGCCGVYVIMSYRHSSKLTRSELWVKLSRSIL